MTRTEYTTRDLTLAYGVSLVVAVIMSISSVAALVDWDRVYPASSLSLLPLFVGQDALNLVVGLPLLVGSMWLARRGSLIGLLLWPGALFYVLYDYGYYVLGAPHTLLFVPYILLMTLSAYAMVGVVASIDARAVHDGVATGVPARLVGGFLAALALLFTALWSGLSISSSLSGAPFDMIPRVVTTLDLTIQLPALFVGGVLLARRHPLGYVVAPGLLLQASAYLMGLSAITVLQEVLTRAPLDVVAVAPGIVVGVIGLLMIGGFIRASRPHTAVPHAQLATERVGS